MAAMGAFFAAFGITVFSSAMTLSVLRCTDVAIGAINELDVRRFFESLFGGGIGVNELRIVRAQGIADDLSTQVQHYISS